jgi:hypothetical protein
MNQPKKPVLSLILCSRNDQYMGNSRWRLQTTLNFVAKNIYELSREDDVEILVADWGSETPLREVLELNPVASRIVSFIQISPDIARNLQKDSPFSEVLALNAVARRASGEYIGRIDQDTLVGKRFLNYFFELFEGRLQLDVPLNSVLLFSNVRMIPYRLCVHSPSQWVIEHFVTLFGQFQKIQLSSKNLYYCFSVGIWLVHRELWAECGGYDERMIYMNGMEVNMIDRLLTKYKMINLGKLVNYDFYHLEHYHPFVLRRSSVYRKVNPEIPFVNHEIINPNEQNWGLVQYHLEKLSYIRTIKKCETNNSYQFTFQWLFFILLILVIGIRIAGDKIIKLFRSLTVALTRRADVAWHLVIHQPLGYWLKILFSHFPRRKIAKR